MVRLAVLTDCLSRNAGGLFNSVRRLAQELAIQGCEVAVFGVADPAIDEDLRHWAPLEPHVLPLCGPRFFGYAPGLVDAIKHFRPDLLQVHGLWKYTTVAVNRLSASLGMPYIVNPHGMLDPWAVRNSHWKKWLATCAMRAVISSGPLPPRPERLGGPLDPRPRPPQSHRHCPQCDGPAGGRRAEVRGRRSEVGGRRSEVGGRRSEVGGRRSEVGGRRSEVGGRNGEQFALTPCPSPGYGQGEPITPLSLRERGRG